MPIRVAIGGIEHETNTYAAAVTGLTTYDQFALTRGPAIIRSHEKAKTQLGGHITAAKELGCEVVPTYFSIAVPSGTIEQASYERMRDELVDSIESVMPVDAICLDMHGAGVAEGREDIESDIGRAIRARVGHTIPLVTSLDLHGNIYDDMRDSFDALIGYR